VPARCAYSDQPEDRKSNDGKFIDPNSAIKQGQGCRDMNQGMSKERLFDLLVDDVGGGKIPLAFASFNFGDASGIVFVPTRVKSPFSIKIEGFNDLGRK